MENEVSPETQSRTWMTPNIAKFRTKMNQKACFSSIVYISCKAVLPGVLLAVNTLRDLYFACQSGSHVAYYEIELPWLTIGSLLLSF